MALDFGRIRAICFDIDGTLADTDDLWVQRFACVLRPINWLFPRFNVYAPARRLVMGINNPANFGLQVLDTLGWDDEITALSRRLRRKGEAPGAKLSMIEGIRPMLAALRARYPLAVVSAREEQGSRQFLDKYDLTGFFQAVITAQSAEYSKPRPDPLLLAARLLGVPAEACLMVGDTLADIRCGKAAGAQTVGVLCGFGYEGELRRRGADLILTSTAQLADHLTQKTAR